MRLERMHEQSVINSYNRHCYLPFQQPFQSLCRYSPSKFLEMKTPAFFHTDSKTLLVQASHGHIFILKIVSSWRINYLVTVAMVLLKDTFFFLKKCIRRKCSFSLDSNVLYMLLRVIVTILRSTC